MLTDTEIAEFVAFCEADGLTFNGAIDRAIERLSLAPIVIYMDSFGFGATPRCWFGHEPTDYLLILDRTELETLRHLRPNQAAFESYVNDLLRREEGAN